MPGDLSPMINGPWHGQMHDLPQHAKRGGRFQPEEFFGEYVKDPDGLPQWYWTPWELIVVQSGESEAAARAAADAEARQRYGTQTLPASAVLKSSHSSRYDKVTREPVEPIVWTVKVRFDGIAAPG